MPYYTQSPLGAGLDAAAGFFAQQQQQKNDALERQRLAAEIAAQQAEAQRFRYEQQHDVYQDRVNAGLDPNTGKPYVPNVPPPKKGSTDAQMADWARATSIAAMQAGNAGAGNYYKGIADSYDQGAYREAETQYTTQGKLPLAQAQTKNVEGLFAQQIKLANIHVTAQEYAAGLRAARAGARARSGGGRGADTEYASALRAIGSEEVRAAVESSVIQYTQAQQNYRASFDQQGNPTQPMPQLQMPNIQIQVVPGPNGQQIPMPVIVYPQQQRPSSRSSGAAHSSSSSSRPAQIQPSSPSSNPLSGIVNWLHGAFENKRTVNGKTYYQHSDGKWYATP